MKSIWKSAYLNLPRANFRFTGEIKVTKVRADKAITELEICVDLSGGTVSLDGNAVCYTMPIPL